MTRAVGEKIGKERKPVFVIGLRIDHFEEKSSGFATHREALVDPEEGSGDFTFPGGGSERLDLFPGAKRLHPSLGALLSNGEISQGLDPWIVACSLLKNAQSV